MSGQAVIFTPRARKAQSDFREALECLARPGRIGQLGDSPFPVSGPRRAYSLLLALADQEVTIAVMGGDETVGRFASLGTGSRLLEAARAGYVLCLADPGNQLAALRRGTLEVPEDGATAIVCVAEVGDGERWRLEGPGVSGSTALRIRGFSADSLAARDEACSAYPLGIDLFLVDPEGRMAGLPRTTRITRTEAH